MLLPIFHGKGVLTFTHLPESRLLSTEDVAKISGRGRGFFFG